MFWNDFLTRTQKYKQEQEKKKNGKSGLHRHLKSTYVKDNVNRMESNTAGGGKW